ncbi:FAD-dependent oxidoreductase [Streptomyces sioyaensis]|uniref:FAD-dependent oxidoreductase n=1 Tax=Streptomyces sioyaensis TaxID=67364 RepID=UPI00378849E3
MNPAPPRIAIIGAGPGGLLCARVLRRNGLPVTVFEQDASVAAPDRHGVPELWLTAGQAALRTAGLQDEFAALARPAGQELRLLDHTATELFRHAPAPGETGGSEIGRAALRRLLLESLPPGTLRWGSYLRTLHPLGDGRHTAEFDDGHTETFDVVIGADGAWSRVRPVLSDATPHYCGVTFVEAGFEDADARHPRLAHLVGAGTLLALSAGKGLLARRHGNGRLHVQAAFRGSQDWALEAGVTMADTEAVREVLLDAFAGWDDRLLALLRDHDSGFRNRPLFALPVPHTWTATPGLTLLGDAAHLMAPFAAEGAGLALLDGGELARALAGDRDADAALGAYEAAMLPRAARAAEAAADALAEAFAPDAPHGTLRRLRADGP